MLLAGGLLTMDLKIMLQWEREAKELGGISLQVTQQTQRKYVRDPDKDI